MKTTSSPLAWAGALVLTVATVGLVWATPHVPPVMVACGWAAWGLATPLILRPLVGRRG